MSIGIPTAGITKFIRKTMVFGEMQKIDTVAYRGN